jgi:hypothetical protein
MKDDFRGLLSSSFCFVEDDEEEDEEEDEDEESEGDEEREGEFGIGVGDDDNTSFDGEESLNLEGLDDLGIRIEFW